MIDELEDARKLPHGTYDDVIVVEHRTATGAHSISGSTNGLRAPHVLLEMPEGSRVLDRSQQFQVDGVITATPPVVGTSYRIIVGPPSSQSGFTDTTAGGSLRYETMHR